MKILLVAKALLLVFSSSLLLSCSTNADKTSNSKDLSKEYYAELSDAFYKSFKEDSLRLTVTSLLISDNSSNSTSHYIGRYHNDFYSTWYVENSERFPDLYKYYLKDTQINYSISAAECWDQGKPDFNLESYFYYTSLFAVTDALYQDNVTIRKIDNDKYSVKIANPESLYKVILGEDNMKELSDLPKTISIEETLQDGLVLKESISIDAMYWVGSSINGGYVKITQKIDVDYSYQDAEIHDMVRSLFED